MINRNSGKEQGAAQGSVWIIMKSWHKVLCALGMFCMVYASVIEVSAMDSDVTLVTEQGAVDPGGGGSSSGGGSESAGDKEDNGEKPNRPGKPSGGQDGEGNDYYLRPGIDVDTGFRNTGYIIGKPEWQFDPNGELTRAEFATILDRVFVFKDETVTKRFEDTKGHWAEEAVCRLASNGVIQGVSSREFEPEGTLKHEEVLLMLGRVLYTDPYDRETDTVNLQGHYAEAMLSQMINSGICTHMDMEFDADASIKRDEMIHLVNNVIYPREKNVRSMESYLKLHGIFNDLLDNSQDVYYADCLRSIDRQYLNNWFTDKK